MNKSISISLFRVSGDSKYLDMIFSCPEEYYFDSLQLEVRFVENGTFKSEFFDLSQALFIDSETEEVIIEQKHWTVRLPLNKLGITVPAIYIATFNAQKKSIRTCRQFDDQHYYYKNQFDDWVITNGRLNDTLIYDKDTDKIYNSIGEEVIVGTKNGEGSQWHFINDEGKIEDADIPNFVQCNNCIIEDISQISDTAICSDVNYAYRCMMDELFIHQKEESCTDIISDEVIRKYLLLYGHQAAMSVRDFETAEEYFRLIGNCFENCGPRGRGEGSCCSGTCDGKHQFRPIHINSCNCGRR